MTNDYLDTEDQRGSMLSHIDYMVLLACAVTKIDTVWKIRSPHLAQREELLLFQSDLACFSTAQNRFNVLVRSYVACDLSSGHNMVLVHLNH